jgi:hypothetical protein
VIFTFFSKQDMPGSNCGLADSVSATDDSKSMYKGDGERIRNLKVTLERITRIALSMDLDHSGINIRFLNYEEDQSGDYDHMENLDQIREKVDNVFTRRKGDTKLGTRLHDKVMKPMVYDKIARRTFRKPLIAVIITDGKVRGLESIDADVGISTTVITNYDQPEGEPEGMLQNAIRHCREVLDSKNYSRASVIFVLSQVGDDDRATELLQEIENDPMIRDMVYSSTERLDDMLHPTQGREYPHGYTVKVSFILRAWWMCPFELTTVVS